MKERTLNRLQPMTASQSRYRPPDQLMQFLLSLKNYAQFTSWNRSGNRWLHAPVPMSCA